MDLNEKIVFSKILNNEIEKTKESILKYTNLCKPISPDNAIGRVSRMDAINNKSVIESALRESKQKLFELNNIKNKMDDKNFGRCLKCSNNINPKRLMIRPNSRLCVNCAS
tara:strand:- start:194 stop:526 length:333 start_codon:yes stop_codon:yes gene_type:complete